MSSHKDDQGTEVREELGERERIPSVNAKAAVAVTQRSRTMVALTEFIIWTLLESNRRERRWRTGAAPNSALILNAVG